MHDTLDSPRTAAFAEWGEVFCDPVVATVETLADYVSHFHPSTVAMTGTPEEVAVAAKAYRAFYRKVEVDDASDYLVDHSPIVYLMGPDGKYLTHFNHLTTAEEIAAGLSEQVDPALATGASAGT